MKVNYRSDIDALRGLSVTLVVLYHFRLDIFENRLFSGGFIGVDIFFVITGYLISKIFYQEYIATKQINILSFYERRIRRLIPILLVVIFILSILSFKFYPPFSADNLIKSFTSSIFFYSNFFFHFFSGTGYWAQDKIYSPLIHTWSLSVEEQFYIIFPFIFLFLFKYLRQKIILVLAFLVLLILIITDFLVRKHFSFVFFMMPFRSWEILCGIITFLIEKDYYKKIKKYKKYIFYIGIILLTFSIFYIFKNNNFHPSKETLVPVISSMLIILSNYEKNFLNNKIFVYLGKISYSLYLWHFVVISLVFQTQLSLTNLDKLLLILFSIFISHLSFIFIEKKFRNRDLISRNFLFSYIFLFISFIIISGKILLDYKLNELQIYSFLNIKKNVGLCNQCWINFDQSNKNKIILLGDSHTKTITQALKKFSIKNKVNTYDLSEPACPYIKDSELRFKKRKQKTYCTISLQKKREKFLNENTDAILIIYENLPVFMNLEKSKNFPFAMYNNGKQLDRFEFERLYLKSLLPLSEKFKKVILIYPTPIFSWDIPRKLYFERNEINNFTGSINLNEYYDTTKEVFEMYNQISSNNLIKFYSHKTLCSETKKKCVAVDDKLNLIYVDKNHLSIDGVEILEKDLLPIIKKNLK